MAPGASKVLNPIRNCLGAARDFVSRRTISARNPKAERPYTVVVEGNIGSGKTTFLEPFTHSDFVAVYEEPVKKWRKTSLGGHNLLQLMYEDPKRWSLLFQTYVHLTMVEQHTAPCNKPIRIMERSLLSARYCFVENLYNTGKLTDSEYGVLSEWFNFLVTTDAFDFKIDEIVYLRTTPEVAWERIKKRSRKEENLIPFEYLCQLHELHEDWLVRKTKFQPIQANVTVIDANEEIETLSAKYQHFEEQLLRSFPLR